MNQQAMLKPGHYMLTFFANGEKQERPVEVFRIHLGDLRFVFCGQNGERLASAGAFGLAVADLAADALKPVVENECVKWKDVEESIPDEGFCVLVFAPEANDQVWIASLDDGEWRYVDGSVVQSDVTHWAELPNGPKVLQLGS